MDESRFDWAAIFRVTGIVSGGAAAFGLLIPFLGALAGEFGLLPIDTLIVSGNVIYRFLYWAIAWGLLVWQGNWMLEMVHERIIDDMLVTSALIIVALLIVKFLVWLLYEPITVATGEPQVAVNFIDVFGALTTFLVGFVAARANRF